MEHQINQLIQKYHHKANSQGPGRSKYANEAEIIRVILVNPEKSLKELVNQLQRNMGVNTLPFRVEYWLEDNQLHGWNRSHGQEIRLEWAQRITQFAQDLHNFVLTSDEKYDPKTLYEHLKSLEETHSRIEHKAILFLFGDSMPDTLSYKPLFEKTAVLANFNQARSLLNELVELVATERGLAKKRSAHERALGGITGTRSLIQSLTRENEPQSLDNKEDLFSEDEHLINENNDLRAAAEIAQHQLEALQEEIEHIRDEAKQETVIAFFQEMNSGQHSHLLDQFMNAELLVKRLKRQGIDIPREIELIPSLIRMFTRFVKMQGIRPKAVIGEKRVITLSESDEYDYTGSSWEDPDEPKMVEIQSAGWTYADTLISKPKVKEVKS